jgi:hypothetical protein
VSLPTDPLVTGAILGCAGALLLRWTRADPDLTAILDDCHGFAVP